MTSLAAATSCYCDPAFENLDGEYHDRIGHAVAKAFVVSVDSKEDSGFRGKVETLIGE